MPRVSATDQMPDFSNWTIGHKKYLLLDKLGSGAYGKVYRALDNSSPAPQPHYVAVKCLLRYPPDSDKDRIQRREIALHKRVSGHPNIVTFYEWFYDGQFVFVVMSLHTGGDLFGAITSKRSYDQQPEKIRATFLQILDAIQHCHDKGVFHRDVKPENIMCSEDGSTVYLGDFGLSTYKTTSREYGCGSSFYMSPECIGPPAMGQDRGYSNRHNDIWALGVILTNLITSRNPWRLATMDDACFAAYKENQDFLKNVLPISSGVNTLLQRIFCFPADTRIAIVDLRQRVLDLDSLYHVVPTRSVELPLGGARRAEAHSEEPAKVLESPNISSYSSLDSDQYVYESALEAPATLNTPVEGLVPPAPATRSSAVNGGPDESTGSGTDNSTGPITPESQAAQGDPAVVIPDVSHQMGGDGRVSQGLATSPPVRNVKAKHDSDGTGLLTDALERLGAF